MVKLRHTILSPSPHFTPVPPSTHPIPYRDPTENPKCRAAPVCERIRSSYACRIYCCPPSSKKLSLLDYNQSEDSWNKLKCSPPLLCKLLRTNTDPFKPTGGRGGNTSHVAKMVIADWLSSTRKQPNIAEGLFTKQKQWDAEVSDIQQ